MSGPIGSGFGGKAGNILITGGNILSQGIGTSKDGSVGNIHITGNAKIIADEGEPGNAAIGGSFARDGAHNSTGDITIDGNANVITRVGGYYIASGIYYYVGNDDATLNVGGENNNLNWNGEYHPHGIGIGAGCVGDSLSSSTVGNVIVSGNSIVVLDHYYDDSDIKINGETYSGHYHLFKNGQYIQAIDNATDVDDFLINETYNQSVDGLGGNDFINNYKAYSSTILGGSGDDFISNNYLDSEYSVIDAGSGNDYIFNGNAENVTINAGDGNDDIYNWDAYVSINAGSGNDTIRTYRTGSHATISGGNGDDLIYAHRMTTYQYALGDGNDTIIDYKQYDSYHKVYTPLLISGDYTVTREKNDVRIKVGNGSILLKNFLSYTLYINNDIVNVVDSDYGDNISISLDNITVNGAAGNDFIDNEGNSVTINSGEGNDSIQNWGNSVKIEGGEGNDSISNGNYYIIHPSISNTTINGGAGNDNIYNDAYDSTIDGGADNDYIENYGSTVTIDAGIGDDYIINGDSINNWGNSVKIDGDDGNDSISNYGNYSTIEGGAGDDSIENWGTNVIINANAGNDLINISPYASLNVIEYSAGDGNDSIYGFNATSILQIGGGSGTYSTQTSGSDIIIKVGDGSIVLNDTAELLKEVNIIGTEAESDDTLDDTADDTADILEILASDKLDNFSVILEPRFKSADAKKYKKPIQITGNEFDNSIIGGKKNDTLGGAGKLINLNSNSNYYTADGVLDKKKKSITLLATTENFVADSKVETIDGSATGAIEITGNKKKNLIYAGANGSTLNGGKGNDTLIGGDGADVFVYENKSGKDVIEGYGDNDSISLDSNVDIKDVKTKKGGTVLQFKGGALTVKDTTEFNIGDTLYSNGVFVAGDSAKIYGSYKGAIDLADYDVANFDGSEGKKKLTITGTDSANSLQGGKKNDKLWGGDGADNFIFQAGNGKDTIMDYSAAQGDLFTILNKQGEAGDFKKATLKDDTLTLDIQGGGKVIFSGVEFSTEININGTSQTVSELIK